MVEGIQELTGKEGFAAEFERRELHGPAGDHGWLRELRRSAMARFEALGFPNQHQEEWRFTNLAPLTQIAFGAPRTGEMVEAAAAALADKAGFKRECGRLVFVNGRFSKALSCLTALDEGVQVSTLTEALEREPALVQPHLAQYAAYGEHPFAALNTAFFGEGVFVKIGRGRTIDAPLHLIYVTINESGTGVSPVAGITGETPVPQAIHSHPRNLILIGEGSQAGIIESYVGSEGAAYLTNAVTEIYAEQGAVIEHLKVEAEGGAGFHFGSLAARLERDVAFTSVTSSNGAALARHDTTAVLDGEGIDCSLNGLYLVEGAQHCDFHTRMEHAKPHCTSRQLYKGILDDRSSGVFNGRIVVRPNAQKTDAIQSSRSLLLSSEATINTQPQLEIFADDVRCTHGAAVGALDDEAIFYLQTRGIDAAAARGLLTYAFAGEVIEKIKFEALRERLEKMLVEKFRN